MKVDVRLNAIVDPERDGGRDLAELARLVAEGGATLVQLRDKKSDTRVMIERARAIKAALAPFNVPLVINDRIDVALVAQADGVVFESVGLGLDQAWPQTGTGPLDRPRHRLGRRAGLLCLYRKLHSVRAAWKSGGHRHRHRHGLGVRVDRDVHDGCAAWLHAWRDREHRGRPAHDDQRDLER